ncbi:MAG: hypothetical protein QXJ06_06050 [Candidatus Aenigmatarchaeota archaeon]
MTFKRILVAILFVVLLAGLLTSFPATSQNGACANCTKVGQIKKCNDHLAVTDGTTQGNCIYVYATTESDGQNTYNCTVTEFYNCQQQGAGCPLQLGNVPGCS